ncbi:hypothetical protein HG536_0A05390 [Torulaspora globosa]|uniref:Uncharacterized protein n=1 Tax=Torulaspora globosa TaxID=48254 RepID=A0A7G3ZB38_9SACH|nr:uncharacterized protein HG536_0A05390 [Torulaspora globosa]QLL30724.1 hypothetical protein HG536_0A05390 [Torulaspora globosa]
MELERTFGNLHLSRNCSTRNDLPDEKSLTDLVDITELFFDLGKDLSPQTIIQDPGFNSFEGTHSLEVNNAKLDSSLISLTSEEKRFSCDVACGDTAVERLTYVTAILDRLARFLVCWLNEYQTLPTTVLSCRYVEFLLTISSEREELSYLRTGDRLYDQVLCDAIYGICYFAKFVQKLLKAGVVFEEEDLNFNHMGLDFLSYVEDRELILARLHRSIDYVESLQSQESAFLQHLLKLICSLVSLESHLTAYSADTTGLDDLIAEATYLEQQRSSECDPPSGCFSMGIQRRLSNQFPPKHLVVPTWNYRGFVVMAEDIKAVLMVDKAASMLEAAQLASFFNKLTQRHVVARALFPLFFIRDDERVLGRYSAFDCISLHLKEFCATATASTTVLSPQMRPVLQEATNIIFEWYQNMAQNTSRYRQGYNRQLLLWDALHAQMESCEYDIASQTAGDELATTTGIFMACSSWVFLMKITAMIEYVLKGFDLEVYKPFEAFAMFWYSYYLSYQQESCLEKVHEVIETKINSIHSLGKKIKKQKNAQKKIELKAQYRHLMDNNMESLRTNKRYVSYLFMHSSIVKSLSLAQVLQFSILKSFGVIDNKTSASGIFSSDRLLLELRLKPFSSIGVPELLTYEAFESTLNDFLITEPMFSSKLDKALQRISKEVSSALTAIDTIKKCINAGDNNGLLVTGTRLVKEQALKYYDQLQASAKAIELNSTTIAGKLGRSKSSSTSDKFSVRLSVPKDASRFFPLLELTKTKTKRAK